MIEPHLEFIMGDSHLADVINAHHAEMMRILIRRPSHDEIYSCLQFIKALADKFEELGDIVTAQTARHFCYNEDRSVDSIFKLYLSNLNGGHHGKTETSNR